MVAQWDVLPIRPVDADTNFTLRESWGIMGIDGTSTKIFFRNYDDYRQFKKKKNSITNKPRFLIIYWNSKTKKQKIKLYLGSYPRADHEISNCQEPPARTFSWYTQNHQPSPSFTRKSRGVKPFPNGSLAQQSTFQLCWDQIYPLVITWKVNIKVMAQSLNFNVPCSSIIHSYSE